MEAVPRVPMLHFSLKQTQQKASFSRLKRFIAECYQEDPDTFSKEIHELETLRSAAYCASIDEQGYNLIKRYYCQLHSLQNRFPLDDDPNVTAFTWRDVYSSNVTQSTDLRHDMAVVLYNYGALHTQLAASAARETEDEMKLACTHFQRAAWAFETVREKYPFAANGDLYPELMLFMQSICFAQAQECILEKSLIDNRKAIIVAKVTSQIVEYYNSAFAALLSGGEEGIIADIVGSKLFREWRQYIQFKVQYLSCILLLYQGQHAEEQQKMGERVTLYQAAFSRLEEAQKETKHLANQTQIADAMSFVMDVVEAKRKAAKNENEFIYHEEVPDISTISTIAGANLVKGIPLNVVDASVAAEDIFRRLIPIKAHEHSSLYSEEKANLLRAITQKIESKDLELNKFMESLSIDTLSYDVGNVSLPQPLVDRCADLNARPHAIPELIAKMSSLAEICVDVESTLQAIQELLSEEESFEKDYQQTMGYRPGGHFIELKREFMKYQEAHAKAGDSNETLRKAMEQHVNNLKILSKSLADLQAAVPTCAVEIEPKLLTDTQMLLNKVNEMRVQRGQLYATLNENIQKDDITAQLIVCGENDVEQVMKTEMEKHEKLAGIIEQNLVAQGNILRSFTDAYAKCAHFIKAVYEIKHKRDIFFSSLINSYDVYDDLLGKSLKGLEFYKKLQNNIHKLGARVRSARDVQDEERQQRIESMNKKAHTPAVPVAPAAATVPASAAAAQPQMPVQYTAATDYSAPAAPVAPALHKPSENDKYDKYHTTAIRPTPIGQENTALQPNCLASMNYDYSHAAAAAMGSEIPFSYPTASSSSYNNTPNKPPMPIPVPSMAHYASSLSGQQQYYSGNANATNPSYSSASSAIAANRAYGGGDKATSISASHALPYASSTMYAANASAATSMAAQQSYANYSMPSATQPSNYGHYASQNVDSSRASAYPGSPYMPASSASMYYPPSASTAYSPQLPASSNSSQVQPGQPLQMTQPTQHNPPYAQSPQVANQQVGHSPAASQPLQAPSHSHGLNAYAENHISTPLSMQQPTSISAHHPMQNKSSTQMYAHSATQHSQPMTYPQYPGQSMMSQNSMSPYVQQPAAYAKPDANQSYYSAQTGAQHQQPPLSSQQYYSNSTTMPYNQYAVVDNNVHSYSNDAASIPYDANYMMPPQSNVSSGGPAQVSAPMPTGVTASAQPPNVQTNNYSPYGQPTNASNAPFHNPPPAPTAAPPMPVAKLADSTKTAKFDLLSALDNVPIPAPTLQPIKFDLKPEVLAPKVDKVPATTPRPVEAAPAAEQPAIDKSDSIEEALAQLTVDEELNTKALSSMTSIGSDTKAGGGNEASTKTALVPPSSADIENFYKEVQRYEKIINGLTTKTLNGTTPLETKWKELQESLKKDAAKRTVGVSKLFPEKNRTMLAVPFDHARVLLPTDTDNYINAAHVQDLGPQFKHYILADAPTYNTVKDFWCMTWSQNSTCILCLTTPDESAILLFPKQMHREQTFGDYTVTVLIEHHHLYVVERRIRLTSNEANQSREIIFIQPKQWPAKSPIANIIRVSQNAIDILNAGKSEPQPGPIILSCMTNMERSCYVLITVTCILALESETPVIINANDIWYRLCSQRNNVLNDMSILQQSMQIILQCCREFIKKKSPKALTTNIQTNYYFIEEEETPVKDPFKDLDPLWKLK